MDSGGFDRMARALGAALTRRAGLRAALAGVAAAALAGDRAQPAAAGKGRRPPRPEGPCGDRTVRDNRCTKNAQCCTGYCRKNLKNKDGNGRCRCVGKGKPCQPAQTCCGKRQCIGGRCQRNAPACTLIPDGSLTTCAANSECCSGFCSVVNGVGRCIGAETVWIKLAWTTADIDLDGWTWMPAGTVNMSNTGSSFPSPQAGDTVNWNRFWYPYTTWYDGSDQLVPTGAPDIWLDIDDTEGPGEERTLFLRPQPQGTYRYAVKNWSGCQNDSYNTSACGAAWANIDDSYEALCDTDVTVAVYKGPALLRTFSVPACPGADPKHSYWWHVVDVSFDASGAYAGMAAGGATEPNGALLTCAPSPYQMVGYIGSSAVPQPTQGNGEVSNICPL